MSLTSEPLPSKPIRWSGEGWLFLRPGNTGLAAASSAGTPVYGGSQAGAVLRYALAPGSRAAPVIFIRAVQALAAPHAGDLAVGFALRPVPHLPVTAHGEARVHRREAGVEVIPAGFLTAGFDAVTLGGGMTARGYAQAGFVGGPDATGFADGHVIAEKDILQTQEYHLALGAGSWAGVQRGSGRLDVGPSASLRLRLGNAPARLSADYRWRVAGNAEPAAGAALTLSAGF